VKRTKRLNFFKIISIFLVLSFPFNDAAFAIPELSNMQSPSSPLQPWTFTDNFLVKREILSELYKRSRLIWIAKSKRYRDLLEQHNAGALLLPSGRYLMAQETMKDDLSLISAVTHEDYEILMQREQKSKPARYEKVMKEVLGNNQIRRAYFSLPGCEKASDNVIFNDLIAKGFELLFLVENSLVDPRTELSPEEKTFLKNIRPVLEARDKKGAYENFSPVFFDVTERLKTVKDAQEDADQRFYKSASSKRQTPDNEQDASDKRFKSILRALRKKGFYIAGAAVVGAFLALGNAAAEPTKTLKELPSNDEKLRLIFENAQEGKYSYATFFDELIKIDDFRVFRYLAGLMEKHEMPAIRELAVETLARLNDVRGLGPLLRAKLYDKDPAVRKKAKEVIKKYEYLDSLSALINVLIQEDDPNMREEVLAALEKLDDPEAVEALYRLKKFRSEGTGLSRMEAEKVRQNAEKTLKALEKLDVPRIKEALSLRTLPGEVKREWWETALLGAIALCSLLIFWKVFIGIYRYRRLKKHLRRAETIDQLIKTIKTYRGKGGVFTDSAIIAKAREITDGLAEKAKTLQDLSEIEKQLEALEKWFSSDHISTVKSGELQSRKWHLEQVKVTELRTGMIKRLQSAETIDEIIRIIEEDKGSKKSVLTAEGTSKSITPLLTTALGKIKDLEDLIKVEEKITRIKGYFSYASKSLFARDLFRKKEEEFLQKEKESFASKLRLAESNEKFELVLMEKLESVCGHIDKEQFFLRTAMDLAHTYDRLKSVCEFNHTRTGSNIIGAGEIIKKLESLGIKPSDKQLKAFFIELVWKGAETRVKILRQLAKKFDEERKADKKRKADRGLTEYGRWTDYLFGEDKVPRKSAEIAKQIKENLSGMDIPLLETTARKVSSMSTEEDAATLIEMFNAIHFANKMDVIFNQNRPYAKSYEESKDEKDLDFENYCAGLIESYGLISFKNEAGKKAMVDFLGGVAGNGLDYAVYVRQAAVTALRKIGGPDAETDVESVIEDPDIMTREVRVEKWHSQDRIKHAIIDGLKFVAGEQALPGTVKDIENNIDYVFDRIPGLVDFLKKYPLRLFRMRDKRKIDSIVLGEFRKYWFRILGYVWFYGISGGGMFEAYREIVLRHQDSPIDMGVAVELFTNRHILASVLYHEYMHYKGELSEGKTLFRQINFLREIIAGEGLSDPAGMAKMEKQIAECITALGLLPLGLFLMFPHDENYRKNLNSFILSAYGPDDMTDADMRKEAERIIQNVKDFINRANKKIEIQKLTEPNLQFYKPLTEEQESQIMTFVRLSKQVKNAVSEADFRNIQINDEKALELWEEYLKKGGGSVLKSDLIGDFDSIVRWGLSSGGILDGPKNLLRGDVNELTETHPALEKAANDGRMFAVREDQVSSLRESDNEALALIVTGNLVNLKHPEGTRNKILEKLKDPIFRRNILEGLRMMKDAAGDRLPQKIPTRLCIIVEKEDQPAVIFRDKDNNLIAHTGKGYKTNSPYHSIYVGYSVVEYAAGSDREEDFKRIIRHEIKDLLIGRHDSEDEELGKIEQFYDDLIYERLKHLKPVADAFYYLGKAAKETGLNNYTSRLGGTCQKSFNRSNLRYCIPMEVFKNAPDATLALKRLDMLNNKRRGQEKIELEIILTGVTEHDEESLGRFNRNDIKCVLGLPDNLKISFIRSEEMRSAAERTFKDLNNPSDRIEVIKSLALQVKPLAENEYMAIAEVTGNADSIDLIRGKTEPQLADNLSLRVLVRPERGKSAFSLAAVINGWLKELHRGRTSTFDVILPVMISPREMIDLLAEKTEKAWRILASA